MVRRRAEIPSHSSVGGNGEYGQTKWTRKKSTGKKGALYCTTKPVQANQSFALRSPPWKRNGCLDSREGGGGGGDGGDGGGGWKVQSDSRGAADLHAT